MSTIDDRKVRRYEQISLYFGDDFVITFEERNGDPFGPVRKRIEAATSHRIRNRKADYKAKAKMTVHLQSKVIDLHIDCRME